MKLPADLERLGVLDELIQAWEANCGEASDRTDGPRAVIHAIRHWPGVRAAAPVASLN
jgi:hypothetical protein